MTVMLPGLLMPWLASAIVAGSVIVVLILCVCQGRKEKVSDHGMPGVVHRIDVDKPLLEVKLHEEHIRRSSHPEEAVHEKTRTVAERALPDIPRILQAGNSITDTDTDQTPDSGSECYATVNKPTGTIPAASSVQEINFEMVHNGRISGTRFSEHVESIPVEQDGFSRSHTYAQVLKYSKTSDHKQGANSGMHFEEMQCQQSTSTARISPLPDSELFRPPSVLHDSFDDREAQSFATEPTVSIAGQAVAGNIPSAEIPYMTPPVTENIHAHSSLDDIQSPYTTISVREPLDRVKKQIVRQQLRQHPNRNPSTEEQEGLYTEVPDDQTYAEIDSGQTSTESSTTYDQIEHRIQDFPPDPPTVESLKTVAQAHSRQASIASVSSSGSGNDGSSVFRDIASLYSVVDKSSKQRQTIHVTENIDVVHRFQEEDQKKVEDMYAKVCKKKPSTAHSTSGILENLLSFDSARVVDDVFASPRSSWSPGNARSRSPPLLPPPLPAGHRLQVTLDADNAQMLTRRHSADPSYIESKYGLDKAEPGYASVGAQDSGDSSSYEKIPVDSDDPGYERIRKDFSNGDPHYEHIGQITKSDQSSSDPGYEHVPGRRVEKSDSIEPGYERIRRLDRFDSDAVDPGYERVRRVKRDTENTDPDYDYIPNLTRNNSDCGEPGYEIVNHVSRHNSDVADPGYERVKLKKTESGQVSRVAIKMDGSFVVHSVDSSTPEDNIPSFSKDCTFKNYSDIEQHSFTQSEAVDNDDVVTVSESPEMLSICINFKPSSEPILKEPVTKPITEGVNGELRDHEQRSVNGQKCDPSVRIQTIAPSNSVSSGDCEDHSSCTATQNSTGYETASSGESMTSASGVKKRKIVLSSNTQEVTVSNSRGNSRKVSLQTEKNVWENGQQVYQEANYSVQREQQS